METSRQLATPRSGVQRLRRVNDLEVSSEMGQLVAAWQTPEKGAPKRVVIRCDGVLSDQASARDAQGQQTAAGFPCAVLKVRYTIGGLTKQVLVDSIGQSALTVWAESVDVEPVWDERRIARIAADIDPCLAQLLGAAINSDARDGDTGAADARWIDAIHVDAEFSDPDSEWSIHPIPEGARGVRFLDALVGGLMTSVPALTSVIAWSADNFTDYPNGVVQLNTNGATDTSILIAPPVARFLFLGFPTDTISSFDVPSWIEWIMAPATLSGY